jgi:predicted sulfurtransferase
MKQPRLPTGFSDPISYTCTCPASTSPTGGLVLLFYRYFASPPSLPSSESKDTSELAAFHTHLTQTLHLGGKIRVAEEGFNITLGGTYDEIQEYMDRCISHWSFAGLDLTTEDKKSDFFKPSPGCACCFGGDAGVRITAEITPMGVTNYLPRNWESVTYLSPEEFHQRCHGEPGDEEVLLVDVRNHYESRIGYFVSPRTGEAALRPAIRRFSQWPLYVRKRFALDANLTPASLTTTQEQEKERAVLTYCTGGIRCEKGARFLADSLPQAQYPHTRIYTLHGGIAAYLTWLDAEILAGRKKPSDSLFKGRNYVFDARGSTGLTPPSLTSEQEAPELDPVSRCHICSIPSDHLSKCSSTGCHLILVVCEACELHATTEGQPAISCCESCALIDRGANPVTNERENTSGGVVGLEKSKHRPICECERERERLLWGAENMGMKCQSQKMQQKNSNTQRSSKGINSALGGMGGIEMDIRVKTFN